MRFLPLSLWLATIVMNVPTTQKREKGRRPCRERGTGEAFGQEERPEALSGGAGTRSSSLTMI